MKIYKEITEEDVARDYLARNGFVAIDRGLAEELAKSDGGVASQMMVYDAERDRYLKAGPLRKYFVDQMKGAANG